MSEAREDKPAEPAVPEAETDDDLRQAIEEEGERAKVIDDPDDPELEPEEDADPEPLRRTREERDRLRQQNRDLSEENRQHQALLERERLQSRPRIDPVRQAQLDQEERERVAMMPLHERAEYWDQRHAQQNAQLMAETHDALDRMNFEQIVRENKLPYSYRLQVENLVAEYRMQGMNASREYCLNQVIGHEVLERRDAATAEARERGERRIASQTVRPSNRGSTAASTDRRGRNQDAEDEALLRSITWGDANR